MTLTYIFAKRNTHCIENYRDILIKGLCGGIFVNLGHNFGNFKYWHPIKKNVRFPMKKIKTIIIQSRVFNTISEFEWSQHFHSTLIPSIKIKVSDSKIVHRKKFKFRPLASLILSIWKILFAIQQFTKNFTLNFIDIYRV